MDFKTVLKCIEPRPSLWVRVWVFFFLLLHGEAALQILTDLRARIDEYIAVDKKLAESNERLREQRERILTSEQAANQYETPRR
jgi:hypothetical protein